MLISDYELKRCRKVFEDMIKEYNGLHEAYFGLGKILYHYGEIGNAFNMLERAIRNNQKKDTVYYMWAALILLHGIRNKIFNKKYVKKC